MPSHIRTASEDDAEAVASIIRESFLDVAERFDLTPETAPTHPSNCTPEWIAAAMAKGVTFFVALDGGERVGCVAMERASPEVCYLERLAVPPRFRHRGHGEALVRHVLASAAAAGAGTVSIAIIAEQTELEEWYRRLGFVTTETRTIAHLPFRVTFMEIAVEV